ncbi:hypothetical protein TRICI_006716 [Trichomonascus ciferrii]|uniref:S-methyl-5'-thioadenosine phosphorylase n=1 Tax=Trichomonascus ciferrii TaxID=44093 RepID=A0A642UEE0_9ASCO|nr:hypothetical protein TRICI_006716 [Trichomonascus ciferrii]
MGGLTPVAKLDVETPWGKPSSPITVSKTSNGFLVAFLARHGQNHEYTPTTVPFQANIAALKSIGVKAIVAFSAVGSLREHIRPRDFVLPSQIIDRTKGIRESSFFGTGFVGHVGFGEPFDAELEGIIANHGNALEGEYNGEKSKLHSRYTEGKGQDLTLVCMEGPAFSTRAESKLYRSWDGYVINMSAIPEAKLAKEAEISYQMVCMSTDYDAWKDDEEPVTVETVVGNLKANGKNAENLMVAMLPDLEHALTDGSLGANLRGSIKFALSTAPAGVNKELKKKLDFLHPGYW